MWIDARQRRQKSKVKFGTSQATRSGGKLCVWFTPHLRSHQHQYTQRQPVLLKLKMQLLLLIKGYFNESPNRADCKRMKESNSCEWMQSTTWTERRVWEVFLSPSLLSLSLSLSLVNCLFFFSSLDCCWWLAPKNVTRTSFCLIPDAGKKKEGEEEEELLSQWASARTYKGSSKRVHMVHSSLARRKSSRHQQCKWQTGQTNSSRRRSKTRAQWPIDSDLGERKKNPLISSLSLRRMLVRRRRICLSSSSLLLSEYFVSFSIFVNLRGLG